VVPLKAAERLPIPRVSAAAWSSRDGGTGFITRSVMLARIRRSMDEKDEGFTLIELLVVMIIIGILAAIAIPVFLNQRQKAVDSGTKSDLKTVADFEETWFVDNNSYTSTKADFTAAPVKFSSGNVVSAGVSATGYCFKGSNPTGSTGTTKWFWYDSGLGGLQAGAAVAATPAGGVCAGIAAAAFVQVS
jgi:type IV pilus assembly protein PilA